MTESGHAVEETKEQMERRGPRADSIFNIVFFGVMGVLFVLSILSWTTWGYRVEDIGVSQLLFVNGVILIAAVVVGMAGFGMAQVSNGLLPLYISASVGNIMFTPLAFVSVGRTFWSVRQHFRWKNTLFPVLGLIPALPAGTYFFAQMSNDQLIIAIAIVLLLSVVIIGAVRQLGVVQQWVEGSGWSPGWKTGFTAGVVAGLLGGAVGIPGPPMILYGSAMMAAAIWAPGEAKAVFTSYFPVLMLYRLVNLGIAGKLSIGLMAMAGLALPGLLIGTYVGIKLYNTIPPKLFGWIVLALLTVNAIILLLGTL